MRSIAAPTSELDSTVARDLETARTALLDLEQADGQSLFGFAVRLGLSNAEAQDAVQEALLRLWTQQTSRAAVDDPRSWTFRTLYRVAMDQHRLRRRASAIVARVGRATGWSAAPPPADPDDIWAEVDRLSDRQRQVVYLRYRTDLPFEEIGSILGISSSAARSHCTFALTALRKRLADVEAFQ